MKIDEITIRPIAHIRNDFAAKFGVPRQSGLVPELRGEIVFEPEYRDINAFRGLEDFSHIWLIWQFSEAVSSGWSPTVRPPRLGGNERLGVFATRSPFRPNSLGLSCVKLDAIVMTQTDGPVLQVSGADLMNGTPVFDVKPYIPYADAIPDALEGFTAFNGDYRKNVIIPDTLLGKIPSEKRDALLGVLRENPVPSYQKDMHRVYGMSFAGKNVRFSVEGENLTVLSVD